MGFTTANVCYSGLWWFKQGLGGFRIKPGKGIGTECLRSRAPFEGRAELRSQWKMGL